MGGPASLIRHHLDRRSEIEKLFEKLTWVATPVRREPLERARGFLEVTTAKDEVIRLTPLLTGRRYEKVSVFSPGGDLMDVSGYGPMWLGSRFHDEIQLFTEPLRSKEEERRKQETFRLVCDDLPSFLQQIHNVVACYREGKSNLIQCLTAEQSRPLLKTIQNAKVEKLSWTKERWDEEKKKLQKRDDDVLILTPGPGFSMAVYITGEKELLLPDYGRLHLPTPIRGAMRRAVENDANNSQTFQLLR